MYAHYDDILALTDKEPSWWDSGVPRYRAYSPAAISDIYARETALAEVRDQDTGKPFEVDVHSREPGSLRKGIAAGRLPIGDPPNDGSSHAGASMTAFQVRVIEYWSRDIAAGVPWTRDASLEVDLEDAGYAREAGR